jgi:hypothetical protein
MPKITKYNWQEWAAYLTASLLILAGACMTSPDAPTAINRAGSLVIVTGVILAMSRKYDVLLEEVRRFIALQKDQGIDDAIADIEKKHGMTVPEDKRQEVKRHAEAEMSKDLDHVLYEKRRVLKIHEAIIVIVGTLTNGFGDSAMKFLTS